MAGHECDGCANVAQIGLSEEFTLSDLTVIGSLDGGGDLGEVNLIYVPEPSAAMLSLLSALGIVVWCRRHSRLSSITPIVTVFTWLASPGVEFCRTFQ